MSNGKTFFSVVPNFESHWWIKKSYVMAQGDNKMAMAMVISCKWNGKSGVPPRVPFAFKPVKPETLA